MNINDDDKIVVSILTAGDEASLEEKINNYLRDNPDKVLVGMQLEQVEYNARTGVVDFGLLVIMTMKIKK